MSTDREKDLYVQKWKRLLYLNRFSLNYTFKFDVKKRTEAHTKQLLEFFYIFSRFKEKNSEDDYATLDATWKKFIESYFYIVKFDWARAVWTTSSSRIVSVSDAARSKSMKRMMRLDETKLAFYDMLKLAWDKPDNFAPFSDDFMEKYEFLRTEKEEQVMLIGRFFVVQNPPYNIPIPKTRFQTKEKNAVPFSFRENIAEWLMNKVRDEFIQAIADGVVDSYFSSVPKGDLEKFMWARAKQMKQKGHRFGKNHEAIKKKLRGNIAKLQRIRTDYALAIHARIWQKVPRNLGGYYKIDSDSTKRRDDGLISVEIMENASKYYEEQMKISPEPQPSEPQPPEGGEEGAAGGSDTQNSKQVSNIFQKDDPWFQEAWQWWQYFQKQCLEHVKSMPTEVAMLPETPKAFKNDDINKFTSPKIFIWSNNDFSQDPWLYTRLQLLEKYTEVASREKDKAERKLDAAEKEEENTELKSAFNKAEDVLASDTVIKKAAEELDPVQFYRTYLDTKEKQNSDVLKFMIDRIVLVKKARTVEGKETYKSIVKNLKSALQVDAVEHGKKQLDIYGDYDPTKDDKLLKDVDDVFLRGFIAEPPPQPVIFTEKAVQKYFKPPEVSLD